MNSDFQRVFDFIIELDQLKAVLRKTKPSGFSRYENSAEHSWQVCLLALLLVQESPHPVDRQRVIELLLVHDIPEIDTGDRIVYQQKDTTAERAAAQRIFGLLPPVQAAWMLARWEEYEAKETHEAVFAHAIDRLMPVLHNLRNEGQSWIENKVPLHRILEVNVAINAGLPTLWPQVRTLIQQFAATHPPFQLQNGSP